MRAKLGAFALGLVGLMLGGCATAAFEAPLWPPCVSSSEEGCQRASADNPEAVQDFLREHIAKYDSLIGDAERGKILTEVPVVLAAVGGATALALGANGDVAIAAAGVGGLGSGLSTYLKPRDRITYVAQARSATTCILREHAELMMLATGAGLISLADDRKSFTPTTAAQTYAFAQSQVRNAGTLALGASDEVVSRLKLRLAGIGAPPDYAAILADLRKQQEAAQAGGAQDNQKLTGAATEPSPVLLQQISEYSLALDTCVAKIL